jgi:L-ascorbate metabolism protein UlaG (beta-lactamase superfamily)
MRASSLLARARLAIMSSAVVFGALGAANTLAGCTVVSRGVSSMTQDLEPAKKGGLKTLYARDGRLSALWIGHASVLIRIDDRLVLTDPVLTNVVGAFARRLVEPGLTAEEIPPGVTVIISHAHFDHLSLGTLSRIQSQVRRAYLPPGAVSYLTDMSFDARELRAWQAEDDLGLKITAVPVVHRAGRYGVDAMWNDATFTGYVIEYHGMRVYFGGDTGYEGATFRNVKEKLGPPDLAILPIGPIHPREFMRPIHEDGYEAVSAFVDLGAKYMLPMHYGTFINSVDEPGEDLARYKDALAQAKLDDGRAAPLLPGEARIYLEQPKAPPPEK